MDAGHQLLWREKAKPTVGSAKARKPKLTDTGLKVAIPVRLGSSPVVHAHTRTRAIGRSGKVGLRRGNESVEAGAKERRLKAHVVGLQRSRNN